MEWAVEEMRSAVDPRAYVEANMRLHLVIARAALIPILSDMYEAIVAIIKGPLTRAELIEGHEEMYAHSITIHAEIVQSIRDANHEALHKLKSLHQKDQVRAVDPSRSPAR
jgi:DNA-binding FadR family transcriptional regulator